VESIWDDQLLKNPDVIMDERNPLYGKQASVFQKLRNLKRKGDQKGIDELLETYRQKTAELPFRVAKIVGSFLGLSYHLTPRSWHGGRCYNLLSDSGSVISYAIADSINAQFEEKWIHYADANQLWFRMFLVFAGLGKYLEGKKDIYQLNDGVDRNKVKVIANALANKWKPNYSFSTPAQKRKHYQRLRDELMQITGCTKEEAIESEKRMTALPESGSYHIIMSHMEYEVLKRHASINGVQKYFRLHDGIFSVDGSMDDWMEYGLTVDGEFMGFAGQLFDSDRECAGVVHLDMDTDKLFTKTERVDRCARTATEEAEILSQLSLGIIQIEDASKKSHTPKHNDSF